MDRERQWSPAPISRQEILDLAKNNLTVHHWLVMLGIENDKASNRKWEQALMRMVISLVSFSETLERTNSELVTKGYQPSPIVVNLSDLNIKDDLRQEILEMIRKAVTV